MRFPTRNVITNIHQPCQHFSANQINLYLEQLKQLHKSICILSKTQTTSDVWSLRDVIGIPQVIWIIRLYHEEGKKINFLL